MSRSRADKRILLVNPWIHDFAAYDFWQKPLGLLYLGALLKRQHYHIDLLDCLDRFNPAWQPVPGRLPPGSRADGSGKYHRDVLEKPALLADVPRKYCRYGAPFARVEEWLQRLEPPQVILLTSHMTYWYPAVVEMAGLLRRFFPESCLILGGIYATLCPDHARQNVKPDHLISGEGEAAVLRLVSRLFGDPDPGFQPARLDDLPWPMLEAYPILASIAMMTSRGCPYRCSYCASALLCQHYRRRQPEAVYDEILHWHQQRNVRSIAFYDDALLYDSERYAKPLLRQLAAGRFNLMLHTPNGIQPRCIDGEMAELLRGAGAAMLRLSYESSRQELQQQKVTRRELAAALRHLRAAGFADSQLGVYLLCGMPEQTLEEVRESALQVHELGGRINLASFSPIPGTREFAHARQAAEWDAASDLLLGNNSLYPLWRHKYPAETLQRLSSWIRELNQSIGYVDED